jgi:hypothetical protein
VTQQVEPQSDQTIDHLLQIPGFAVYQGAAYRDIVDVVLDGKKLRWPGRRIGDLPLDFGLTEDLLNGPGEVMSVANVLAFLGYREATLLKDERPDFFVDMPEGRIGIEHTRAFTGYQRGSEDRFYEGISELRNDENFNATIDGLAISLVIERSPIARTPMDVLQDPEPQGFIGNRDVTEIVAQTRALAERGYFQTLVGKGRQPIAIADAPALAKFHATVDVDVPASEVDAGLNAAIRMWKPGRMSLFVALVHNIVDKTEKVAKYPETADWLVVQVVAPPEVFDFDLALEPLTVMGPFKKIFVVYPHIDGRMYFAVYSAEEDGSIRAEIPELPVVELPYDDELHEWAKAVEHVLEPQRIRAWLKDGNGGNVPKMTSDPTQVQWYRKWLGPYPWVLCRTREDRILMCFWSAENWDGRRIEYVHPRDIDGAAERIWNFIVSDAATAPRDST